MPVVVQNCRAAFASHRLVGQSVSVPPDDDLNQQIRFRLEILDGLLRALSERAAVDETVWNAKHGDEARARLTSPPLSFSDVQALHILDAPLRRRTEADRARLQQEVNELRNQLSDS